MAMSGNNLTSLKEYKSINPIEIAKRKRKHVEGCHGLYQSILGDQYYSCSAKKAHVEFLFFTDYQNNRGNMTVQVSILKIPIIASM